ncbi:MAG: hypothetical protein U5N86_13990 [Planctomycetota bacterium]|nr:hypothetical protein [Planctomycetota bacterium]
MKFLNTRRAAALVLRGLLQLNPKLLHSIAKVLVHPPPDLLVRAREKVAGNDVHLLDLEIRVQHERRVALLLERGTKLVAAIGDTQASHRVRCNGVGAS